MLSSSVESTESGEDCVCLYSGLCKSAFLPLGELMATPHPFIKLKNSPHRNSKHIGRTPRNKIILLPILKVILLLGAAVPKQLQPHPAAPWQKLEVSLGEGNFCTFSQRQPQAPYNEASQVCMGYFAGTDLRSTAKQTHCETAV